LIEIAPLGKKIKQKNIKTGSVM